MSKKHPKKTDRNPKRRIGDIPQPSNMDIKEWPGGTSRDNPEVIPDIPRTLPEHPQKDGCGDESAGRKPARCAQSNKAKK